MFDEYMAWAQSLSDEQRVFIWGGCLGLVFLYAAVASWDKLKDPPDDYQPPLTG